ncbi:MAG TPA: clostripain-related cysteine peptidase [Planctomycetota bacterium]|nr:clostripain-related cysteine peptidase [Planctomycetota bacterium]
MRRIATLLATCLLALSISAAEKAKWTLMCYSAADNDLEAPMMDDLREMAAAGASADVKIIVLAKRSPKSKPAEQYSDKGLVNLPNWTSAKLLQVEKDKLVELQDWGNANSGSPETLKKFILTTAQQCPAERYALIMSDHGASWPGACSDESSNHSMLTTADIRSVLAETTKTTGTFEFIGFDACLMGSLEVASMLAPFGRFFVASEELEPGVGWNYTPVLAALHKNPAMTGADLGRQIVDCYKQFFDTHAEEHVRRAGMGVTLGVIALEKIPALEQSLKSFAQSCAAALEKHGRKGWLAVAKARAEAERYGGQNAEIFVVDIAHFASLLKKSGIQELAAPADSVEKAVQAAVLHKIKGKARPHANGLSIFFPANPALLDLKPPLRYSDFPIVAATDWAPMLKTFCALADGDDARPDIGEAECEDHTIEAGTSVELDVQLNNVDDIEESYFILTRKVGDSHIVMGQIGIEPDEEGRLQDSWDGEWFTVEDGEKKLVCPVTGFEEVDDEEDTYFVEVPVQVLSDGEEEWLNARMYFYIDFNNDDITGEFVYAFRDGRCGPREVELSAGDKVRPMYVKIDAKGESTLVASDDDDDIIAIDDPDEVLVKSEKVEKGKYVVGFLVKDYAGNTDTALTEVEVQ